MKPYKKIEVVINALEKEHFVKILEKSGIRKFTMISEVTGRGDRGWQDGEGLTDSFKNVYFLVACSAEELDKLTEPMRLFIKKVGGVCMVSDVMWLKH